MLNKNNKNSILKLANSINDGEVCISPSDTVYALLCDAKNIKSVEKIYDIKQRDLSKRLAIFCKDVAQIKEICEINDCVYDVLKNLLPGKFTFVLKLKQGVLSNDFWKDSVGVRIPDCNFIQDVLRKCNNPIASTSANLSNNSDTSVFSNVSSKILNSCDTIVFDENLTEKSPSCVIDLTNFSKGSGFKILRNNKNESIKFINFVNKKYKIEPLKKLMNIGVAMEKALIEIEIYTKKDFLSQDFIKIYEKLTKLNKFYKHKMIFYALFCANYEVNCVKIPQDLKKIADRVWDKLDISLKSKKA